jgi:hypothetical protein
VLSIRIYATFVYGDNYFYTDISHQIIEHRKEPNHMTLEIHVPSWSMHTYVAIVNVLFTSLSPCRNNYHHIQICLWDQENQHLLYMFTGCICHLTYIVLKSIYMAMPFSIKSNFPIPLPIL